MESLKKNLSHKTEKVSALDGHSEVLSYCIDVISNSICSLNCQYAQPMHIISKVSQSDFYFGSDYSNCSYYQRLDFLRLDAEHMFDSRSDSGSGSVSLLLPLTKLFVLAAFTLNMFSKTQFLKFFQPLLRPVSRISKTSLLLFFLSSISSNTLLS